MELYFDILIIFWLYTLQKKSIDSEIKQISFAYQQNIFPGKRVICKMENENIVYR